METNCGVEAYPFVKSSKSGFKVHAEIRIGQRHTTRVGEPRIPLRPADALSGGVGGLVSLALALVLVLVLVRTQCVVVVHVHHHHHGIVELVEYCVVVASTVPEGVAGVGQIFWRAGFVVWLYGRMWLSS